jgi:hypothetical protein
MSRRLERWRENRGSVLMKILLPSLLVLGVAGLGGPAVAQQNDRQLIIYGNDRCPVGTVCVRAPEADRYRIPQTLRTGPLAPADQPWAGRAASVADAGAASGGGSCSAAGNGGFTGCLKKEIDAWGQERKQQAAATADSALPH